MVECLFKYAKKNEWLEDEQEADLHSYVRVFETVARSQRTLKTSKAAEEESSQFWAMNGLRKLLAMLILAKFKDDCCQKKAWWLEEEAWWGEEDESQDCKYDLE